MLEDLAARVGNLEAAPGCDHQPTEGSPNLAKEIDEVKERLEERTNRQLRQTLVIKGVRELPNKGPKGETWEETKQLLASTIAKNVKTSYDNAYKMLNRVHRSRPTANPNKRGQRDIFANLFSWDHCDKLVEDFRLLNVRGHSNIHVEFKYGPLTTNRRIQAMGKRKLLKTAGEIISGYVAYPARLMVKAAGSSNYHMIEDFSRVPYKEYKRSAPSPIHAVIETGVSISADGESAPADEHHELGPLGPIMQAGWSNPDLTIR